jgi:AcrR family transcriptional regulator
VKGENEYWRLCCFSDVHVLKCPAVGEEQHAVDCVACARLRSALLEALTEHDPGSLTAADLTTRAGLPETALSAHYGTLDDCLAATFDELADELYRRHREAFAGPGDWHARLSSAADATVDQLRHNPGAVRLCFAYAARGDERIRTQRAAARQRFVQLFADEYEREHGSRPPDVHFEFLFGALFNAAHDELAAGQEPARVAQRVKELLGLLEPVAG